VRTEAVARNVAVRLSVKEAPGGTCWVIHTGAAAQCRCVESPPAVCSGGALEIKTVVLGASDRVGVAANVASIAFDPMHGTSTPTGTLRLVDARGRAVHHVVNVMGRVRSCSPSGVPGWRAC
jgi:type IV fimbrial biogenesis protein FimT